jgi:hypothetical protein
VLCTALDLDASSPDILDVLRDSARVPTEKLTHNIETERLGKHSTFRGVLSGSWWAHASAAADDPMAWQRSGALARALREKGVRRIVLGDLTEEWYLYSIAHDLAPASDGTFAAGMLDDVARYFPRPIVERLVRAYEGWPPPAGTPREDAQALFGRILADGQVHLPVRVLERDLTSAAAREGDMPSLHVVRYEIRWTPEQVRPFGTFAVSTRYVLGACSFGRRIRHARNGSSALGVPPTDAGRGSSADRGSMAPSRGRCDVRSRRGRDGAASSCFGTARGSLHRLGRGHPVG